MLRFFAPIVLVFMTTVILVISVSAQSNTTVISWYSGGSSKLFLNPIPVDTSSSIAISGTTSQKTLIVTVAKTNGPTRSNPVPVDSHGAFNVRYLIKDGVGTYTVTFFSSEQNNAQSYQGLGFFTYTVKTTLPSNLRNLELNGKIIQYVDKVIGTTVGRGECWDLAQEALDQNLADWARPNSFGLILNNEKDDIKAGDIIQFRTLKITEHLPGGITKRETFGAPDHTAVVYRVIDKNRYSLAHQNVGGKRNVVKGDINLENVTSGKYWIYRPVALMIQQ